MHAPDPVTQLPVPAGTFPAPTAVDVPDARYIRPLAGRRVRGLAWIGDDLLVLDTRSGRLMLVDPATDDTQVVNEGHAALFLGAQGLAVAGDDLWFTTSAGLHSARWIGPIGGAAPHSRPADDNSPSFGANPVGDHPRGGPGADPAGPAPTDAWISAPMLVLPIEGASAVAAWGEHVYLVRGSQLEVRDRRTLAPVGDPVTLHGIGEKGIAATADALWVSDDLEQTVHCLDRRTRVSRFMVVTPLERPTAITARRPSAPAAAAPTGDTPPPPTSCTWPTTSASRTCSTTRSSTPRGTSATATGPSCTSCACTTTRPPAGPGAPGTASR